MLQYLNQKRGQSTLEYAVLTVVVIGALLTLQVYLKRADQGSLKKSADEIGDQYSDGNTNVIMTTIKNSDTTETDNAGNTTSVTGAAGDFTNTITNSVIVNTAQEFWGDTAK